MPPWFRWHLLKPSDGVSTTSRQQSVSLAVALPTGLIQYTYVMPKCALCQGVAAIFFAAFLQIYLHVAQRQQVLPQLLQKLRRRYSTHLLLLAFVGIAAGVALGYTGSANWVILFLPCVWAVLTCRDTGMGKPLLLFTLGLAVLDAIIKQMAFLESFSLSNFLWNLASGCILYAVLGGMGWLIAWLLHYAKESTHENKE